MEDWWGERHFYLIATSQNPTEYMRQYLKTCITLCIYNLQSKKIKKEGTGNQFSMCVRAHL